MDSRRKLIRDRVATVGFVTMATLFVTPMTASAQVRVKKPDRGVYQSPTLTDVQLEVPPGSQPRPSAPEQNQLRPRQSDSQAEESQREHLSVRPSSGKRRKKLVEVELEEIGASPKASSQQWVFEAPEIDTYEGDVPERDEPPPPGLQPVNHVDVILAEPLRDPDVQDSGIQAGNWEEPPAIDQPTTEIRQHAGPGQHVVADDHVVLDEPVFWNAGGPIHESACDGCPSCVPGCDTIGCDSMGTCCAPWYRRGANASLCFDSRYWFCDFELLLLWRRGEHLPPLVTTSTDTDPDTAGEIGRTETQVLAGVDSVLKDLRAGGRLTLGTWLDNRQCRSLVMRGWFAGEETYGFGTNPNQTPSIFRPFLDVTNDPAEQNTVQVAFPGITSGVVSVQAGNEIYGADVSIRQFWYGKHGGTVDFLYGYQFMRMNDDLRISSTSTSLIDDPFRPLGSVIAIDDSFEVQNEFHGGQLGFASRYREGCYSYNCLAKVGFGSLARRAKLAGSTLTSNNGVNAVDPNGLLVRSTNAGTSTDHTFGWVPELDLSLGWHRFPRFDVTFGYHVIAMTDALRAAEAIDPNLAVNLADPVPSDAQRPARAFRYSTYYVQGIHFGLKYVY